jgi:thiosulfate/3-mercaptopyruvate sulfurtransferase
MEKTITTAELAERLGNPATALIDVRPLAAYNGWPLRGETRGGHIPGAVPLPYQWTEQLAPAELKGLLKSKGISDEKRIIVYGYTVETSLKMLRKLDELGYSDGLLYETGLADWAADESLPMERLANYDRLVHPDWLHRLITHPPDKLSLDRQFEIFHVSDGAFDDYLMGHIPTAVHLDTSSLEAMPNWDRLPDPELEGALVAHGIAHDKMIVLYGHVLQPGSDQSFSARDAGQIAAARAAAILMYAGVEDVRILDGGLAAWISAGYALEQQVHHPKPVKRFGQPFPARPDLMVDIEGVREMLADPSAVVVSARSWAEFIGETSGYATIQPAGRIAGAVWGRGGTDAYHMEAFRNPDNSMRDYRTIQDNWKDAGVTADKRIAFYCGTGWRASETFFVAHLLGFSRIAVYDGGWHEWSQDESNPVERGIPPKSTSSQGN